MITSHIQKFTWPITLSYLWSRTDVKVFVVAVAIMPILYCIFSESIIGYFQKTDKFSLLTQTFTTMMLVFIWLGNLRVQWVRSLNNFINIKVIYDNKTQLTIELVPLAEVADIRTQTQALLKAINNEKFAKISPYVTVTERNQVYIDNKSDKPINNGKPFELYQVEINLTENLFTQTENKNIKALSEEKPKLYWRHPFTPDKIEIIQADNQPKFIPIIKEEKKEKDSSS